MDSAYRLATSHALSAHAPVLDPLRLTDRLLLSSLRSSFARYSYTQITILGSIHAYSSGCERRDAARRARPPPREARAFRVRSLPAGPAAVRSYFDPLHVRACPVGRPEFP